MIAGHARFSDDSQFTRRRRGKTSVETGESDDARTDRWSIFSVVRWWIFRQSLLDVGDEYLALGSSSRDPPEGTIEVCVVTETMGGGTNVWLVNESSPPSLGL